jgi:hypothetical protein
VALGAVLASGASSTTKRWRPPTVHERFTIVRDMIRVWFTTDDFAVYRRRGLHPAIRALHIAKSDRYFASAAFHPLNRRNRQVAETATVALMQATGRWLVVIGPATDFSAVCQAPAPRPIRDLFC